MEVLFSGGYPSPLLPNGFKSVNCGAHIKIEKEVFEVMNKDYSNHHYNGVSMYIPVYGGNFEKVEISLFLLEENNYDKCLINISYYSIGSDTYAYRRTNKVAKRWLSYIDQLKDAHKTIFNGSMS